jgi:putative Ca2+/H+ antiporter (TMEM165/GDT1 family)
MKLVAALLLLIAVFGVVADAALPGMLPVGQIPAPEQGVGMHLPLAGMRPPRVLRDPSLKEADAAAALYHPEQIAAMAATAPLGEPIPALSADLPSDVATDQYGVPVVHKNKINNSFQAGFLSSLSMVIVSEIGDKTFFIAAILSMRSHKPVLVFCAAISALAAMTVLSVAMGFALPNIISPDHTQALANLLFLVFGLKLIWDASRMEAGNEGIQEELHEVEEELDHLDLVGDTANGLVADVEAGSTESLKGKIKLSPVGGVLGKLFSPLFLSGFSMTFFAEWGDRSQIATIALAAARHPVGVTLGGILGHACCTGVAVYAGKMLSTHISERTVNLAGGLLFILFAIHGYYD